MEYKVICWNVNSLVIRYNHLITLINLEKPHFIFLQETRLSGRIVNIEGYYNYFHGTKGRNGVAILSLFPLVKIEENNDRYMEYQFQNISLVCVYIPNGGSLFSPVEAKIKMINYISNKKWKKVILGGDWNLIWRPLEINIQNPYSQEEMNCLKNMEQNLISFVPKTLYLTWWDYRNNMFKKNRGIGLDKFYWKDISMKKYIVLTKYRAMERPSDHAPVLMEFSI